MGVIIPGEKGEERKWEDLTLLMPGQKGRGAGVALRSREGGEEWRTHAWGGQLGLLLILEGGILIDATRCVKTFWKEGRIRSYTWWNLDRWLWLGKSLHSQARWYRGVSAWFGKAELHIGQPWCKWVRVYIWSGKRFGTRGECKHCVIGLGGGIGGNVLICI